MPPQTCYQTKQIVRSLLAEAQADPGQFFGTKLSNNLRVEVRCQTGFLAGASGRITLRISRTSSYPSLTEWRTVTSGFPYPVAARPQQVFTGRCCLVASFQGRMDWTK